MCIITGWSRLTTKKTINIRPHGTTVPPVINGKSRQPESYWDPINDINIIFGLLFGSGWLSLCVPESPCLCVNTSVIILNDKYIYIV